MQYTDNEAALIGGLISNYFFQPSVDAKLRESYRRVLRHLQCGQCRALLRRTSSLSGHDNEKRKPKKADAARSVCFFGIIQFVVWAADCIIFQTDSTLWRI